jgi:hypothetical protein
MAYRLQNNRRSPELVRIRRRAVEPAASPLYARVSRIFAENASNMRLVGGAGGIRTDRRPCSRSVSHLNTSNRRCQKHQWPNRA